LATFLGLLLARNASVNLVSRRTAAEVLERQVLPSLAALRLVPPDAAVRVLDVGTGGGFPGIPLRILRPGVRLDLVDATRNKCRFLEECVGRLGWEDARVHWCRIETPADSLRERGPFELILARAVGREDLIRRALSGLLAETGSAWAFAPPGEGEIEWTSTTGEPLTGLRRLSAPRRP
jgi:16S rRNA (guanine527-N7)-methyltransferase